MHLVRKLKISKLTSVEFTDTEQEIVNFIYSKLYNLNPFKYDYEQLSIYYMDLNGRWILEQDDKLSVLWVNSDFWKVLEQNYSIEYKDIQSLLNYMVKVFNITSTISEIEDSYKQKVVRPITSESIYRLRVEDAYRTYLLTNKNEV